LSKKQFSTNQLPKTRILKIVSQ